MSTFQQIREGIGKAWETLSEEWQHLYRRAANAITRFTPSRLKSEQASQEEQEIAVRSSGWGVLAAEVFDDDDRVVVRLEAPGLDPDDFDIQVRGDMLVVLGQKKVERERSEGRYHVVECAYGSFERAIPLPEEVVPDKAAASYKKGVLRVELPKSTSGRRKSIQVKMG
jgi:HSP20 family protein